MKDTDTTVQTEETLNAAPEQQPEEPKRRRFSLASIRSFVNRGINGEAIRPAMVSVLTSRLIVAACILLAGALVYRLGAPYAPFHAVGYACAIFLTGALLVGPRGRRFLGNGMHRVSRTAGHGLERCAQVILITLVVLAIGGFVVRGAKDSDAVAAFYRIRGDGWGGRTVANWVMKPQIRSYGPVKVAKLSGGTAVSYWGRWVLVDPVDEDRVLSTGPNGAGHGLVL